MRNVVRQFFALPLLCALLAGWCEAADFPEKSVRFIVPFPLGHSGAMVIHPHRYAHRRQCELAVRCVARLHEKNAAP